MYIAVIEGSDKALNIKKAVWFLCPKKSVKFTSLDLYRNLTNLYSVLRCDPGVMIPCWWWLLSYGVICFVKQDRCTCSPLIDKPICSNLTTHFAFCICCLIPWKTKNTVVNVMHCLNFVRIWETNLGWPPLTCATDSLFTTDGRPFIGK